MQRVFLWVLALTLVACQNTYPPYEDRQARTLVNVGEPELVFSRPVAEIVPELQQATLSDERGRVGDELVFWTFDLPDGERRWLYACAILPDLDCAARAEQVCAAGTQAVLLQKEESGAVRRMNCQLVGQAAPGDLYPNCTDHTETRPVMLGLLDCGQ